MSNQSNTSPFSAVLAIFFMGIGLFYFIAGLIDKLNSLNSELSKAMITGGVTIFAAIVTLVIGKIWEQKMKIQQDVREKKIPVYEKQIETFFEVMFHQKYGPKNEIIDEAVADISVEASEEYLDKVITEAKKSESSGDLELKKAFMTFTEKLIIWGSPEVIKAWSDFRLHDWENSSASQESVLGGFKKLDSFIRSIRKDVGNSTNGLDSGELMRLFVNDLPQDFFSSSEDISVKQ